MPNRILKESIRESDSIDSLTWFEEVLFYRLIVSCDDYGRFDGRISVIKNRLFPLKEDLTLKTVSRAIDKLVTAGLVALYEFEGKPFLYLPTWTAHQNVRAKRSKYPEPVAGCENMKTSASRCMQMQSEESNGNQMQGNVPVIQSESISESISNTGADDGDAHASEKELAFIGLKKDEYHGVTKNRVLKTVAETNRLFLKFREGTKPNPVDRRMVFLCSRPDDGSAELLDYAFEQAQLLQKENDWRYIVGIIKTLRSRNITTMAQALRWDDERPDLTGEEWEEYERNKEENRKRWEASRNES